MVFKELEKLKAFLKEDHDKADLNPIRFINVDSLQMWIEVKKYLITLSDKSLLLSDFCETDDTTPNLKRMNSILKKATQTLCVFPLSEYMRVHPENAVSLIKNLLSMEFQNNDEHHLHIYFPLYRVRNVLQSLSNTDPRKKNAFVYLQTGEEQDYQLTIIQNSLDAHVSGNEINGFKHYLRYWEQNPDKPLVLRTGNAVYFDRSLLFDNVKVIVTPYDLCLDQLSDFPVALSEEFGSYDEWFKFSEKTGQASGFDEACGLCLSTNRYSIELFESWSHLNPFKRWILWIWTKVQDRKGYVYECAQQSVTVGDFILKLYTLICEKTDSSNYIEEYKSRREQLRIMQLTPPAGFWRLLENKTPLQALSALTTLTDIERKKIFTILNSVDFRERLPFVALLKTIYPQLYYYLNNDTVANCSDLSQLHNDYFVEYKWLKVTNSISDSFVQKVKTIAKQKGESVFVLQPRMQLVTSAYDDNTIILFVDGMGIEYADYLAYLFSGLDKSKYNYTIQAGYCNLPTITEINKDFMDDRNTIEPPMRELDEHKHANCVYPENIIKELDILDFIKDKALSAMTGNISKVIIASDHGTSRLAVRVRNTEHDNVVIKPDAATIYKHGRFCKISQYDLDYETAIRYDEHLIFADYSRFVQSGAPIDEIHGGASLEEWLVPVVILEKIGDIPKAEKVIIDLITKEIKPEIGTGAITVRFKISGRVRQKLIAQIKGKRIVCDMKNDEYSFSYIISNKEESIAVQIIDRVILGDFVVKLKHGIKQNKKFDI